MKVFRMMAGAPQASQTALRLLGAVPWARIEVPGLPGVIFSTIPPFDSLKLIDFSKFYQLYSLQFCHCLLKPPRGFPQGLTRPCFIAPSGGQTHSAGLDAIDTHLSALRSPRDFCSFMDCLREIDCCGKRCPLDYLHYSTIFHKWKAINAGNCI